MVMTFDEIQKRGTHEIKLYSKADKIAEIVKREDMVLWATRPPMGLPLKQPAPLKLTPAAAYMMGVQMIKRVPSLILP